MRAMIRSRLQRVGEGEEIVRVTTSGGALTGAGGANGCGCGITGRGPGVGAGANLGKLAVGPAE